MRFLAAIPDRLLFGLLVAGVVAVALAGLVWIHQRHAAQVIEGAVQAERAAWQETHRQALAAANAQALRKTTEAAMAALEVQIENAQLRESMQRDRAAAVARTDSLQRTIAAFRDRAARAAAGSPPGSLAHEATAAADALSECSSRRAEVAAVADQLSVQVSGLQAYISKVAGPVCIAPGPNG